MHRPPRGVQLQLRVSPALAEYGPSSCSLGSHQRALRGCSSAPTPWQAAGAGGARAPPVRRGGAGVCGHTSPSLPGQSSWRTGTQCWPVHPSPGSLSRPGPFLVTTVQPHLRSKAPNVWQVHHPPSRGAALQDGREEEIHSESSACWVEVAQGKATYRLRGARRKWLGQ